MKRLLFLILLLAATANFAQQYSIDWHTVAGGGGTSGGGSYSLSGTIGQHDAGPTATGGNFSLTGGFWSLISTVPTAGAPTLYITLAGSTVTVCWQDVGSWALQQSGDISNTNGWTASSGVTTATGTNCLALPNTAGNLFFRLK